MPINALKLKELLGLDLDVMLQDLRLPVPIYERILRIAVISSEKSLAELQGAVVAGDMSRVQKLAHELKGTYGNLRVQPLYSVFMEIDAGGRANMPLPQLQALYESAKTKYMALKVCFPENVVTS